MNPEKEVVVVTGSNGLIGYAACLRLAEQFAVVGFDNEGSSHPPPSLRHGMAR